MPLQKRKRLLFFSMILLTITVLALSQIILFSGSEKKFVSLSITLDAARGYEELYVWLKDLDCQDFTFVVDFNFREYWLENETRCNTLKQYGNLIPLTGYLQAYEPEARKAQIDSMLNDWVKDVGFMPKGVFCFQPDTFTVNYLETQNVSYVQGYCFDQFVGDYMTMRGGWQLPYYPDVSHANKPSENARAIVILSHATFDWVASFTASHELNTHLFNLKSFFRGNMTAAENYFFSLIDESLSASKPFGYAVVQFEWCWAGLDGKMANYAKDWIVKLIKNEDYSILNFGDFAAWFRENYALTPDYLVDFTSPYSKERIEWFYSREYRIARVGERIVSFVDYLEQDAEKFLSSCAVIDMGVPASLENSIDNSLRFSVDALGGGNGRSPLNSGSIPYSGKLTDFTFKSPN